VWNVILVLHTLLMSVTNASSHINTTHIINISTNSRATLPENLFVTLIDDHFDDHAHTRTTLEHNARAILVSHKINELHELTTERNTSVLHIPNTLITLDDLAHYHHLQ